MPMLGTTAFRNDPISNLDLPRAHRLVMLTKVTNFNQHHRLITYQGERSRNEPKIGRQGASRQSEQRVILIG